jgi:N-acetylmuramic acid 6-phosphate etherase
MGTERSSPRYSDIDAWDAEDIAEAIIEGQLAAVAAVHAARGDIAAAASAIYSRLGDDGRLIYAGAGTSGRLAAQDGAELVPTFDWPEDRLLFLIAGGHDALLRSIEGAEDDVQHAIALIEQHAISASDVLVAVAASGTTPFTLACLREGKRRGALTVGIANNSASPLLQEADHAIYLATGSEPIAGSTRLKAGTAQKVTLNTLSSLLMILLGKVYRGLMVDVRALNEKLSRRSEHMLIQLTGCDSTEARNALNLANGRVKVAALLLEGCDLDAAEQILHASGNRLGEALALAAKRELAGKSPRA